MFIVNSVQVFEKRRGKWDAWCISEGIEGGAIEGVVVGGDGVLEERGEVRFTGCVVPGEMETADGIA